LSTSKKKKKKKSKNLVVMNGNEKGNNGIHLSQINKQQHQHHSSDYMNVEPARILHNPSTNMVTIRNPAFGPPPPKMESNSQQAAIIKVAENGMVTIRSPALQQAINAGLQPPPKPDFIVKGSTTATDSIKVCYCSVYLSIYSSLVNNIFSFFSFGSLVIAAFIIALNNSII
jgi:hypothetical protein